MNNKFDFSILWKKIKQFQLEWCVLVWSIISYLKVSMQTSQKFGEIAIKLANKCKWVIVSRLSIAVWLQSGYIDIGKGTLDGRVRREVIDRQGPVIEGTHSVKRLPAYSKAWYSKSAQVVNGQVSKQQSQYFWSN